MKNKSLFFQFFTVQILLIFMAIFVSSFFTIRTLVDLIYSRTAQEQEAICRLLVNMLPEKGFISLHNAQDFCYQASSGTRVRLTLIQYSGSVLADSHSDPFYMENHFDRPEIQEALRSAIGRSKRFSFTMREEMFYTAIPVPTRSLIVRTSISVEEINREINQMYLRLTLSSLIILFFAVVFSYVFARTISSAMTSIKNVAKHYAAGDFTVNLEQGNIMELNELSEAINSMGIQLKEKIRTITSQKDELQAMLNSMTEPVILVDKSLEIREYNPSARKFIFANKYPESANLLSVINNVEITELVESTFKKGTYNEKVICFNIEEEIYYLVHVSYIENLENDKSGALIVLNNISAIKHLEQIRKDFVANVSHELKTPVTSIIGYVETIMSGSDIAQKNIDKFMNIISRQASRLVKIIEDLLTLSRVDYEHAEIETENIPLSDLIGSSVSACSYNAELKDMKIHVSCDEDLELHANTVLAEQALTNLIDNAVKYSNNGTDINIRAEESETEIFISVEDFGPGITQKDLKRIFERFYRVDKARSRELGGTGLGLAIVKHVLKTHSGRIEVDSVPGEGSKFTIIFPRLTREVK